LAGFPSDFKRAANGPLRAVILTDDAVGALIGADEDRFIALHGESADRTNLDTDCTAAAALKVNFGTIDRLHFDHMPF
jgi:hypothetical protein